FFAYFLCGGKESKCRPAQGQHWQTENKTRTPAKAHEAEKANRVCEQEKPEMRKGAASKNNPKSMPTRNPVYLRISSSHIPPQHIHAARNALWK
ncbi:MAG TPA: hypothetical protein VN289_16935, partial [Paraburkholderia sp.]|nr:hypothetical protein [Paraburkholderia sp.]